MARMTEAITGDAPAVFLEPRRMYEIETIEYPNWESPDAYAITFGDAVLDAAQVAVNLETKGIKLQVYPIEDVSALDLPEDDVPTVVVDTGHISFGAAAEVSARLAERGNHRVKRIGPPFVALPTSSILEDEWYPSMDDISSAICKLLDIAPTTVDYRPPDDGFIGPF